MKIEVKVFNDKNEKLGEHVEIIPEISNKIPRFVNLPDGWIRDLNHGLDWGPSSSSLQFSATEKYCTDLGGRLPTVDELQTLIDRTTHEPAIDKKVFADTKSEYYWTSTKTAWCKDGRWVVGFFGGSVSSGSEVVYYFARPVRVSQ